MTTPCVTETTPDSIATRSPAGEYGRAVRRLQDARETEAAARLLLANALAARYEAAADVSEAAARLAISLPSTR